jgi:hypothetical protein
MKRFVLAGIVVAASFGALGTGAQAASNKTDPPCAANPNPVAAGQSYTVSASGLPTNASFSLWITGPTGVRTTVTVGKLPTGTLSYTTSSPYTGTWNFDVIASKTKLFSSCSVQVT